MDKGDRNNEQASIQEETESEEEQRRKLKQKEEASRYQTLPLSKKDLPLPPNPENVIIRPYDPKAKPQQQQSTKDKEAYFKSPLTGELIPGSSLSEHMRISMLDPRWIEQKHKERKEREEQEEVFATGVNIEKYLKGMAEYRSDLFGHGAEEVLIGKKIGEEEKKKEDAVAWDGHTNTVEKTAKKAMTGISLEDQIKSLHQSQGFMEDDANASKIGPALPKSSTVAGPGVTALKGPQPPQQQSVIISNYKMLNVNGVKQPLPMNPLSAMNQIPPMPVAPATFNEEEPSAKRQKTEESLMPEAEFAALYGTRGPIKFNVQIPVVPEKPEWNLNGQLIPFSMHLTESVIKILFL